METEIESHKDALFERLKEKQKDAPPMALVNSKPDKWLFAAEWIAAGKTPTDLRAKGYDNRTIARIKRDIQGTLDIVNAERLEKLRDMRDVGDSVIGKSLDEIHNKGAILDGKELYFTNKVVEDVDKRIGRMEGLADVVVEHRHVKTPEELAKDFEEMFNQIPEAEVIDEA